MPIPVYEQRTRAGQAGLGPGPMDTGQGLGALGQAVSRVGDVLTEIKERDASAEAAVALSGAQVEFQRRFYEAQQTVQPGAPDFTKTILDEYDKYGAETLKGAKTKTSKRFIQTRLAAFRTEIADQSLDFEAKERTRHRGEQIKVSVEQFGTFVDLDPDSWRTRAAEAVALIDGMNLPPAQNAAEIKATTEYLTKRAVVAYGRRDPDATLSRLVMPAADDVLFRNLTPDARDAMLKEVEGEQRARWQEEDQAYQREQRAEKEAGDTAAKDMDRLLAGGGLSARWLEQNRERLTPADYRYGYRKLTGEDEAPTNPTTYADLRLRASRGEDVRDDARHALLGGRIKTADFDRLVGEVEATRPNWYKRGVSYLTAASGYSDLNPDPDAGRKRGAMLDAWGEWANENPKAGDDQARKAWQQIESEFSLIDRSKIITSLRAPRYMVGGRLQQNLQSIEAAEAATVRAYRAKQIDEAEFKRQATILKQWKAAIARTETSNGG